MRIISVIHRLLSSLWAGSLWFSGFAVAPVVFTLLASNKQLAGKITGTLFSISGYIGLVCGLILFSCLLINWHNKQLFSQVMLYILLAMLLLVSINLFIVQPEIIRLSSANTGITANTTTEFKQLHTIASGIHLGLSVLAIFLVSLRFPVKKADFKIQ